MNTCPVQHSLRPDLPPLAERIAALPVDERGYPIPFFVSWIDGKPDFRIADSRKHSRCIKENVCWVCGQPLGKFKAFVIGPMCAINRTAGDPPAHLDCALWSVKGCPFLTKPKMHRREDEISDACKGNVGGILIERNPGVSMIWTTKTYTPFPDGKGGVLMEMGEPEHVTFWREGRTATRAEIEESIRTGLPSLVACCEQEEPKDRAAAHAELKARTARMMKLLPSE
jgi:hypothetical protein